MKFSIQTDIQPDTTALVGGQFLSGQVILELGKDEITKGLTIKCSGRAEVHWKEKHILDAMRRAAVHSQGSIAQLSNNEKQNRIIATTILRTETFFEYDTLLFGQPDGSDAVVPAGSHEFPFSFELPAGIPASFQGSSGFVKYLLEAKLDRGAQLFDYDTKAEFDVVGLLDLNNYPGAANPVELRKEEYSGFWCCKSKPVGFSLKMDRTGFVHGETIDFTVNLFNMNVTPLTTSATLVQNASFHAGGQSKTDTTVITAVAGPNLSSGETKLWEETCLLIPNVPPSKLGGCEIVDVDYDLKIDLSDQKGVVLSGIVPLMIGTTPFQIHLYDKGVNMGIPNQSGDTSAVVLQSADVTEANSAADLEDDPN